jgi:glycosyltransferase involved in cell wall biosynthesis
MRISLVIPARDEVRTIARTLDDLRRQTRRPDEIVLVDAGSVDGTAAAVEQHVIGRDVPTRVIRVGAAFPGRARNAGVRAASGDWIAFTDAGISLAPSWLATLERAAEAAPDAEAVAGDWDVEAKTRFAESIALVAAPAPNRSTEPPMRPPCVPSLLIRRDAWERAGPFREDLRSAEDLLFLERLHQDSRIIRASGRFARWELPQTPIAAWRRFRTYARHNIRAGLFNQWQGALLRRYGVVVAGTMAAATWTTVSGWLAAGLLTASMLAARACVATYRNRGAYAGGPLRQARRGLVLIPILVLVDAAALAGSLDWLALDARHGTRIAPPPPDTPADRPRRR